jgi:hypothetical protein
MMAYTYAIDPKSMFEDRTAQFVSFGLPEADVTDVAQSVTDMWADASGGWVYEWSPGGSVHRSGRSLSGLVGLRMREVPLSSGWGQD